jgi:hypothetical protein
MRKGLGDAFAGDDSLSKEVLDGPDVARRHLKPPQATLWTDLSIMLM